MITDVTIIGAGVVGSMTARALSKYELSISLVDRYAEPAGGTSDANSGIIHAGYDAKPDSLKAQLNVLGNQLMPGICRILDVPFKQIGSLVLAFDEVDEKELNQLLENGINNGVSGLEIITKEEVLKMEPSINDDVKSALYAPSAGIVCPYELTTAALEAACGNGVEYLRSFEVISISYEKEIFTLTAADGRQIQTRNIVNAAGVFSDKVANMVGDYSFAIKPRKGEYVLFEKNQTVSKVIFQTPRNGSKGILVSPTVDGNLFIGPNAIYTDDPEDTSTSLEGLAEIKREALKSSKKVAQLQPITNFAGLRATSTTGDFVINNPLSGFFNAGGIESPGLSSSPAIADYIVKLMAKSGLQLTRKERWSGTRERVIRFRELSTEERCAVIAENPEFGQIICRCEQVTEAEIRRAIRGDVGARTVDGVKRRTRAGMGRCQGGFCSPRVMEILAEELNCGLDEITKYGGNSYILVGKNRELKEESL